MDNIDTINEPTRADTFFELGKRHADKVDGPLADYDFYYHADHENYRAGILDAAGMTSGPTDVA